MSAPAISSRRIEPTGRVPSIRTPRPTSSLPTLVVVVLFLVSGLAVAGSHPNLAAFGTPTPAHREAGLSPVDGAQQVRLAQASLAAGHGPHPALAHGFQHPMSSGAVPAVPGVSLAYDAADGYVLALAISVVNISGTYTWGAIVQTWTYHAGNWTELSIAGSPPNRGFAALAYDPTDGYVLLFGGESYSPSNTAREYLNDTWSYVNGTWTNLTSTVGPSPSPRGYALMTWDAADGYAVLVGGYGYSGNISSTWTYVRGAWSSISTSASIQPEGALAYDAADGYVVYFGGASTVNGALNNDTWKFLNGTWTNLTALVTGAPSARANPAMGYDPNYGAVLLFGGIGQFTGSYWQYLNDTWTYRALKWTLLSSASGPAPREEAQLVFDASDNVSVLFGGLNFSSSQTFSDTWSFAPSSNNTTSASGWTQAAPVLRPSSAIDDVGAAVQLHAIGVEGTNASYSYTGLPPGCTSADESVLVCVPSATGTFTVSVATSSATGTATAETSLKVIAAPTVAAFEVSPGVVETNGVATFTTTPTGGLAPYTLSYSGLPANCPSQDSPTLSCAPQVPGSYVVTVRIVDSLGVDSSAEASMTVVAHVTVSTLSASPGAIDLGQTTSISAVVGGGFAPFTFGFSGVPTGCPSVNSATYSCTPSETGTYPVSVQVSDWLGYSAQGLSALTINPDPTVTAFAPSTPAITLGDSVTFAAVAAGGTGTLSYSYAGLPAACAGSTAATFTCTPTGPGNYTVSVAVVDSVGYTATASATFSVASAPIVIQPGNPHSGGSGGSGANAAPPPDTWGVFLIGLGVGLLALAVSLAALLWRARVVREGVELVRQMQLRGKPRAEAGGPLVDRPADPTEAPE